MAPTKPAVVIAAPLAFQTVTNALVLELCSLWTSRTVDSVHKAALIPAHSHGDSVRLTI